MGERVRFCITGEFDQAGISDLLDEDLRLLEGEEQSVHLRHLDTFDWRLWQTGARATWEKTARTCRLCWLRAKDNVPQYLAVDQEFRFARELPDGVLRQELEDLSAGRALLVVGESRVHRRTLPVINSNNKAVVRLWLEAIQPLLDGRPKGPLRNILRLESLRGYERIHDTILTRLQTFPGLEPCKTDVLVDAVMVSSRQPGDYSSKLNITLQAGETANHAIRLILRHLLRTIKANVQGVIDDVDVEFLHDLRVATRRSRTCLGQLAGILPTGPIAPFVEEFRWLGEATGLCRDLDVFLIEIDQSRGTLAADLAPALGPLIDHIQTERKNAHRELILLLRSRRFNGLLSSWERFLKRQQQHEIGEMGSRSIEELARESTLRAFRRFSRHAHELSPDLPALAMHRLRIDAKKLRYLLEFFQRLWGETETGSLIRELKLVQDALGSYHDAFLQRQRLLNVAQEMNLPDTSRAMTIVVIGHLIGDLERIQAHQGREFLQQREGFVHSSLGEKLEQLVSLPRGG